jgi:hypothetical protein
VDDVLADHLGDRLHALSEPESIDEAVSLLEKLADRRVAVPMKKEEPPKFFVSYAKDRPAEADFVEMSLRRRGLTVLRDERDFGAGLPLPSEIKDYISRSDIFIAIWCKEYARSPWCFDELDLALERRSTDGMGPRKGPDPECQRSDFGDRFCR